MSTRPFLSEAISRRNLLVGGAAGLGTLFLAGCTEPNEQSAVRTTTTPKPRANEGDLALAALAASLENLTVNTYQTGLDAAAAGDYGEVPVALTAFLRTVQRHHRDHAAGWNGLLRQAGRPPQTGVNLSLNESLVRPELTQITDVPGFTRLILALENTAAATYQNAVSVLIGQQSLSTAATIQPVEMQHAAVLRFLMGQDPMPVAFSALEAARTVADELGPAT